MAAEERELLRNLKTLGTEQMQSSQDLEESIAYDPFAAVTAAADSSIASDAQTPVPAV